MKVGLVQTVSIMGLLLVLQGCKTSEVSEEPPFTSPPRETTILEQKAPEPVPTKSRRREPLQITCPAEWMAEEGMPLYTLDEHDRFLDDLSGLDGYTVLLEFYGEIQMCRFANSDMSPVECGHWGYVPPEQHAPILKPKASTNVSIEFTNLYRYVLDGLSRCERAVYGTGERYWSMAVKIELSRKDENLIVILHPQ